MTAEEIKAKIEGQRRVSAAMKKALAAGRDEFEADGRFFRRQGDTFMEREKASQREKKMMSPKEKLQARMQAVWQQGKERGR